MAKQQRVRFRLPAAEDDLWHEVVVHLLNQRDADEVEAEDHLRFLEELAFHHRLCRQPLKREFVAGTGKWLAEERGIDRRTPATTVRKWLRDLEQWELLIQRGGREKPGYEFALATLDDYFAACHLAARWREGDEPYREWLPRTGAWWRDGQDLRCPNPCCRSNLPRFSALVRQPEHEEVFLLLVGLLFDLERERTFVDGLRGSIAFKLKALGRCRHEHAHTVKRILGRLLRRAGRSLGVLDHLSDGFVALSQARVQGNLDRAYEYCISALRRGGRHVGWNATAALNWLGVARPFQEMAMEVMRHEAFREYMDMYTFSDEVRYYVKKARSLPEIAHETGIRLDALVGFIREDRNLSQAEMDKLCDYFAIDPPNF